jgi:hypothetical protein
MALMMNGEAKLADLIGEDATLRLVEHFGGTRLPIPKGTTGHSQLHELIGQEATRKLTDAYGGTYIKVPLAKFWRAQLYRERGLSYGQIATKLGCSESSVHTFLRDAGKVGQQPKRSAAPAPAGRTGGG